MRVVVIRYHPDYSIISIEEYNEELNKKMENNYE